MARCQRERSRCARRKFTDALKARGVKRSAYSAYTNQLYVGLFDQTAKGLKRQYGVQQLRIELPDNLIVLIANAEELLADCIACTLEPISDCIKRVIDSLRNR